jgi:hypothetical protein
MIDDQIVTDDHEISDALHSSEFSALPVDRQHRSDIQISIEPIISGDLRRFISDIVFDPAIAVQIIDTDSASAENAVIITMQRANAGIGALSVHFGNFEEKREQEKKYFLHHKGKAAIAIVQDNNPEGLFPANTYSAHCMFLRYKIAIPMNHTLLSILAEHPDFTITGEERKIVEFFVEYMDHNSLWLLRYEAGDDPVFVFTNEAQHFTFTLSQIRQLYKNMKSGIPMNWEEIPFEYISDSHEMI